MDKVGNFILGLVLGFMCGFLIMNMPNIMKNSGTYIRLQREQMIERRK